MIKFDINKIKHRITGFYKKTRHFVKRDIYIELIPESEWCSEGFKIHTKGLFSNSYESTHSLAIPADILETVIFLLNTGNKNIMFIQTISSEGHYLPEKHVKIHNSIKNKFIQELIKLHIIQKRE
mgnify:FL=1